MAEALTLSYVGHRIYVHDGKLLTKVLRREPLGVAVRIAAGPDEKGQKLRSKKVVNFLDVDLDVTALTDDDRAILPFLARHADAIEFSFTQSADDVAAL